MQILLIIIGLSFLAAVVYGYFIVWFSLNERCLEKHQFKPLNGWSMFAALIAAITIYVGVFMTLDRGGAPPWPWGIDFLFSQTANGLVLASGGVLIGGITVIWLIVRTTLLSGLLAAFLLTIAGTLFFLIIVLYILMLIGISSGSGRKRVYILD